MATEDATRRGATDTTARAARAGYAISGTARSGSSWFAGALDSTGALGHPADAFNTLYQRRVLGAHYPADRAEQIRLVLTEGATENGIYGVKVFPIHLFRMGSRSAGHGICPTCASSIGGGGTCSARPCRGTAPCRRCSGGRRWNRSATPSMTAGPPWRR